MQRIQSAAFAVFGLCTGIVVGCAHAAQAPAARTASTYSQGDLLNWFGCDPAHCDRASLARLQAFDPDNAALWLPAVAQAQQTDPAAIEPALEKVARGKHYDDYVYSHAREQALTALPKAMDFNTSQSVWSALAHFRIASAIRPMAFDSLDDLCLRSHNTNSNRRAACVHVGFLLQTSPSLSNEIAGDSIVIANTGDSEQRVSALQDKDAAGWQVLQLERLSLRSRCDAPLMRMWIDALRRDDTEQAMAKEVLGTYGVPLKPPSGWSLPAPQPPPPPTEVVTCSK